MKKKYNLYTIYSILFIIVAIVGFAPIWLERKSLIGLNDAFNQYFCAFCYFGRWIRSGISGGFNFFDTSIGLGESVIGTLDYYGFGDVLLIPFVLFPEKYLHYAFSLSMIFRLYLAGLSFIFYWKRRDKTSSFIVIAAFTYVFSAYTFTEGYLFHSFLSVLVWLPLIASGVSTVLESDSDKPVKRLDSIVLILSVAFLGLVGFYFLYMVLAYVAFRCLIFPFFNERKNYLKKLVLVVAHLFMGMGISCVLLLPAVMYFLNSSRNEETSILSIFFELPSVQTIINGTHNLITPPENVYDYLSLSLPIIAILCIVTLFRHKDVEKRGELITGCLIVVYGYYFPAIGTAMNGFQIHYDRWLFLAHFFFACLIVIVTPVLISSFSKIDGIICASLLVVWVILYLCTSTNKEIIPYRMVCYSILWGLMIIFVYKLSKNINDSAKRKISTGMFFIIAVLNVFMNLFFMNCSTQLGGSEAKGYFIRNVRSRYNDTPIAWNKQEDDENVWGRYDIANKEIRNEQVIYGLNTADGYFSIMNGEMGPFLGEFDIWFPVRGLDARQVFETLLSVKKYSCDGWGSWTTEVNDYFLPLGVIFDGYVTEDMLKDKTILTKQSNLLNAVVLETGHEKKELLKTIKEDDITEVPVNITYEGKYEENDGWISVGDGTVITVKFNPDNEVDGKKCELYLLLENIEAADKSNVYVDNNLLILSSLRNHLVCVDYANKSGEVKVAFKENASIKIGGIKLYKDKNPSFTDEYNYLQEHYLRNAKWEGDSYSGITMEEKPGYLFLGVPYIDGWTCYIDDVKTDILRADYNFMAVYVPEGKHEIRFSYKTPWFGVGIIVSIVSLVLFLIFEYKIKSISKYTYC